MPWVPWSKSRVHCSEGVDSASESTSSSDVINDASHKFQSYDSEFANSPGPFEELHSKCKNVMPMAFDGAKLSIMKGLSAHFQVTHTLLLSPHQNAYKFGATFAGNKKVSPQETYPVLLGEMDLGGNNANAQAIHLFGERLKVRAIAQVMQSKLAAVQMAGEYKTRVSNFGLTVVNPNIVNDTGVLVAQYLRRITPRFDLGGELMYQSMPQIPGGQMTSLSYAARYSGDSWIAAATLGRQQVSCTYYHRIGDDLQVGVEWETRFMEATSTATLAYQADLTDTDVVFKGSVDTNYVVTGVLEKKIGHQFPLTLQLSAMLDHKRTQSRFGIGLVIG